MTKTKYFDFSNFTIPYIIAEIGLNHNGNEELALKMVEAAARSGANAVKFQLYKTENFIEKKGIFAFIYRRIITRFFSTV